MKIKTNLSNESLYCIYSKQRIEVGEKYIEIEEPYFDGIITKTYKLDYAPSEEEYLEEDPWIVDNNNPENGDIG